MSELILIGIVALIIFGPRKLPGMAKTVGKTMADLRRASGEFRDTWEREVSFEEEKRALRELSSPEEEKVIIKTKNETENFARENLLPEIREVDSSTFEAKLKEVKEGPTKEIPVKEEIKIEKDKRSWL